MQSFRIQEQHWNTYVDYFYRYPQLCTGKFRNSADRRDTYKKQWDELSNALNSIGLGQRTTEKWQKTWCDYKCALKRKVTAMKKLQASAMGAPASASRGFSNLEEKFLGILGDTFSEESNSPAPVLSKQAQKRKAFRMQRNIVPAKKASRDHNYHIIKTEPDIDINVDNGNAVAAEIYLKIIESLEKINDTLDKKLQNINCNINLLADKCKCKCKCGQMQ